MKDFSIQCLTPDEATLRHIHELWYASVKATHLFLTDSDIAAISPLVSVGLQRGKTFGIGNADGQLCAFIHLEGDRIEMLFVHPQHFRQGYGKALLDFAEQEHGVRYVDVNEQNPQALQFYTHCGYVRIGRSALDSSGAPFPLLHLEKRPKCHQESSP